MTIRARCTWWTALLVVVSVCWSAGHAMAERPTSRRVDLFTAMDAKQVDVEVFACNAHRANLLITNRTDEPLRVGVPAAMALAPAMGQMLDRFDWDQLGLDQREQPQQVGAGPEGPWQFDRQPEFFNPAELQNFFCIPPEKVARIDLVGVCLDHGMPEPNPRVPFEVHPIDQATSRPEVAAAIAMHVCDRVNQTTAQLAVWHLQNGKTWDELADERVERALGSPRRYSRRQIDAAKEFVEWLEQQAAEEDASTVASTR
jgi:hypothetical protein